MAEDTGESLSGVPTELVAARLHILEKTGYADLLLEWPRLFRAPAPKWIGRELLILGIAWKIQEQTYGGHRPAAKRRLADLAKTVKRDGDVTRDRVARLKPGARLVREWRSQTHTVVVTEDGFEWQGKQWRSLTAIAHAITGTKWSGPRFFALTGKVCTHGNPEVLGDA